MEKIFFWSLLGILALAFFWMLAPFSPAIVVAIVLALTFEPLYRLYLKITRQKKYIAAFLSLLSLILFLALPAGVLFSLIVEQLLKTAEELGPRLGELSLSRSIGESWLAEVFQSWQQRLGFDLNLPHLINELLQKSAQAFYKFSPKVVAGTANFFFTALLTLILTYFFLIEGAALYHEALDLSPLDESYEKTLALEIRKTLSACIYGQILTAVAQGILAGFGFWAMGVPAPLLLGLATFIMAFVPFFGTAAVWVPVFIGLVLTGTYGKALFLALYGTLVISGIDNLLKPLLIQGKTQIHPVLLFLVIFGGLRLWGPIGILIGPTLTAVFLATLKIYKRDFR